MVVAAHVLLGWYKYCDEGSSISQAGPLLRLSSLHLHSVLVGQYNIY